MIFRCFTILSLSVFISLSVYAEVLYENPIENIYGRDINKASLQELVDEANRSPVDGDVIKAQYILGVVFTKGLSNWNVDQDLKKGRELLLEAWSNDAVDAGYILAQIYYEGLGVEKDNKKSLGYLKESAEKGLLISQRALGKAYLGHHDGEWDGLVHQNVDRAIFWLKKAANSGDLVSANILANVYYMGELVAQDYKAAFAWMLKSTESRYGVRMQVFSTLAELYEKGIGTDKDFVQAYKYYDLNTPAGDDDKARVAKEMTQEQIDEAVRQSRAWQEEHNIFVPSYDGLEYQEDGSFR